MAGSSHGHTPAAWTGVTIAFIGFCISAAFTVMAEPLGFVAGIVVVVLGGVVGLAMRAGGMGQPVARIPHSRSQSPSPSRTEPTVEPEAAPEPQPQR